MRHIEVATNEVAVAGIDPVCDALAHRGTSCLRTTNQFSPDAFTSGPPSNAYHHVPCSFGAISAVYGPEPVTPVTSSVVLAWLISRAVPPVCRFHAQIALPVLLTVVASTTDLTEFGQS